MKHDHSPIVMRSLAALSLFIGMVYVVSPQHGLLLRAAQFLSGVEQLNPHRQLITQFQSILLAFGFHDHTSVRLLVGLLLILLGSCGLLFEQPLHSARSAWALLCLHAFAKRREDREAGTAEFATRHLLRGHPAGQITTDPTLLVGGLLSWGLKGALLSVFMLIGCFAALITHLNAVRGELASGLVKDKLTQYLTHVQLGRIPSHARGLLADIGSLRTQLLFKIPERELTRQTLQVLDLIDQRATNADPEMIAHNIQELRESTLRMIDGAVKPGDVYTYPLKSFDNYYYVAYLLSAAYVGLNELNRDGDPACDDWVKKIVDHTKGRTRDTPELGDLNLVVERIELTYQSQLLSRPATWSSDPRAIERLDGLAERWRAHGAKVAWHEDRERSRFNAAVASMMALRVVGDGAGLPLVSQSPEYLNLCSSAISLQHESSAANRVADYFSASERVQSLFGANIAIAMTRAEAFAVLAIVVPYLATSGQPNSLRVADSIVARTRPYLAVTHNTLPTLSSGSRQRVVDLEVSLVAEELLALDEVDKGWRGLGVWGLIRNNQGFANGLFWNLHDKRRSAIVARASERASVEIPTDR